MSYVNTFITLSDDCPDHAGTVPPLFRGQPSKAGIEYELLTGAPYTLDHDDLNYRVYCQQREHAGDDAMSRAEYLAVGRPCLRASALVKRYGWGAHYDSAGRIALYRAASAEYATLRTAKSVEAVFKGMATRRA